MNYIIAEKSEMEVLIFQAPCFTNEPKLFWQLHTGSSLSRPPVSTMQLPAVFFADQPKRKQRAKVSRDGLFSCGRPMGLQKTKKLSVRNKDATLAWNYQPFPRKKVWVFSWRLQILLKLRTPWQIYWNLIKSALELSSNSQSLLLMVIFTAQLHYYDAIWTL